MAKSKDTYFQTIPPLASVKVRFPPKGDANQSRTPVAPPRVINDAPTKVSEKQAELIREMIEDDLTGLSQKVREVDMSAVQEAKETALSAEEQAVILATEQAYAAEVASREAEAQAFQNLTARAKQAKQAGSPDPAADVVHSVNDVRAKAEAEAAKSSKKK